MQKVLNVVLLLGVFVILFLGYFHTITAYTQDLGRHLLTGKIIIDSHTIPKVNLFSYTYPNFPFINHHWLSEVVYYLVYIISGDNGLLLLTVITILVAFGCLVFYARKRMSIFAIVLASLLYFPILFERTDIRPEIFSFLFLSIYIVIMYLYRERYTRWIFILIPLQLLWTNMHIYFPIGIAVIGLFWVEEVGIKVWDYVNPPLQSADHSHGGDNKNKVVVKQKSSKVSGAIINKKLQTLTLILTACTFVTLINPNWLSGATYPFRVFQNYGYSIEENQNVFFLEQLYPHESIQYFFIAVALLSLFLFFTIKKSKPIDWMLVVFFTYLGASAVRNLPLFVFGTFLIFSNSASIIMDKIIVMVSKKYSSLVIVTGISIILCIVIVLECFHVASTHNVGFGVVSGASGGTEFFLKNNLKGPIFNNFDIGSYIEYRMYPHEKVFMDGRPEAYPKEFFQNVYIPMQENPQIFDVVDRKYKFNAIFFSYTDQTPWAAVFVKSIAQNNNWKLVYLDDFIAILLKQNNENKQLISKYGMDEANAHISHFSNESVKNLIDLAYFFDTVGWTKQEESIYQSMLQKDHNNCTALYNLSVLFQKESNPAKESTLLQAQTFCPQMFGQQ